MLLKILKWIVISLPFILILGSMAVAIWSSRRPENRDFPR